MYLLVKIPLVFVFERKRETSIWRLLHATVYNADLFLLQLLKLLEDC